VVEDRRGDECTKGIADDVAAEEKCGARAELAVFVPLANEEERAWEEGRFDDAEEETGNEYVVEAEVESGHGRLNLQDTDLVANPEDRCQIGHGVDFYDPTYRS
jgi:hypothetical protein